MRTLKLNRTKLVKSKKALKRLTFVLISLAVVIIFGIQKLGFEAEANSQTDIQTERTALGSSGSEKGGDIGWHRK